MHHDVALIKRHSSINRCPAISGNRQPEVPHFKAAPPELTSPGVKATAQDAHEAEQHTGSVAAYDQTGQPVNHLWPMDAAEETRQFSQAMRQSEALLADYLARIDAAERRLAPTLQHFGIVRERMPPNRDCQFSSLAWLVYGDRARHEEVRKVLVTIYDVERDWYSSYLEAAEDPSDYYERMSRLGAWGDETTLQIFIDLVGLPVVLFTDMPRVPYHAVQPQHEHAASRFEEKRREAPQYGDVCALREKARGIGVSYFMMTYIADWHYDAVASISVPLRVDGASALAVEPADPSRVAAGEQTQQIGRIGATDDAAEAGAPEHHHAAATAAVDDMRKSEPQAYAPPRNLYQCTVCQQYTDGPLRVTNQRQPPSVLDCTHPECGAPEALRLLGHKNYVREYPEHMALMNTAELGSPGAPANDSVPMHAVQRPPVTPFSLESLGWETWLSDPGLNSW